MTGGATTSEAPAPLIGIIGGMGPEAGLDLARKIFALTEARTDQEHLPVALLSYPGRIEDRTAFLLGHADVNPAGALAAIAGQLEALGATVAGMACNTAHAPPIFDALTGALQAAGHRLRLLHMIGETARCIREARPEVRRVGVLATTGTLRLRLYDKALEAAGLEAVAPDEAVQERLVQPAIYDAAWGIKARSHPVAEKARRRVLRAAEHLRAKGAEAVVLGCTELPLAVPEEHAEGLPLVDPATALARALIRATYPERLLAKARTCERKNEQE